MPPITCHILDTTRGMPAELVTCSIYYVSDLITSPGDEESYNIETPAVPFAMGRTNKDGRITNWVLNPENSEKFNKDIGFTSATEWSALKPGNYKIKFLTGQYFHKLGPSTRTFFPFVEIHFIVNNPPDHHYHIPLLLSNFSYTTYRGS